MLGTVIVLDTHWWHNIKRCVMKYILALEGKKQEGLLGTVAARDKTSPGTAGGPRAATVSPEP